MTESSSSSLTERVRVSVRSSTVRRLLGLMGVIVLAETAFLYGLVSAGLAIHAVALLAILGVVFATRGDVVAFEALLFVPLLRLLNLGMENVGLHPYLWLATLYVLVVAGLAAMLSEREFTPASIGVWPPPTGWAGVYLLVGLVVGGLLGVAQWTMGLERSPVAVTPVNALLAVLVVGVLVGFVEELLFRGVLQPASADVVGTPTAIVSVSVLFSFMHSVWMEPMNVLFAFLVSLYLGWEYARRRNFWYVWLVHTMINAMAYGVLPLWLGDRGEYTTAEIIDMTRETAFEVLPLFAGGIL